MMNYKEAIQFAVSSAYMGHDQNMIESYRDNIRCTLQEEKATQYEVEAWEAFDATIAKIENKVTL